MTTEQIIDKIEIVGPFKSIQYRVTTVHMDGDVEIGRQHHRQVVNPGDNKTDLPEEVAALCKILHTPERKKARSDHLAKIESENKAKHEEIKKSRAAEEAKTAENGGTVVLDANNLNARLAELEKKLADIEGGVAK